MHGPHLALVSLSERGSALGEFVRNALTPLTALLGWILGGHLRRSSQSSIKGWPSRARAKSGFHPSAGNVKAARLVMRR